MLSTETARPKPPAHWHEGLAKITHSFLESSSARFGEAPSEYAETLGPCTSTVHWSQIAY